MGGNVDLSQGGVTISSSFSEPALFACGGDRTKLHPEVATEQANRPGAFGDAARQNLAPRWLRPRQHRSGGAR
jgi:hypothetical protein